MKWLTELVSKVAMALSPMPSPVAPLTTTAWLSMSKDEIRVPLFNSLDRLDSGR